MVLLGKIMILQGVGHPISCLGVCYANDPKKGGYTTPAPALDLTTSLRGDLPFPPAEDQPTWTPKELWAIAHVHKRRSAESAVKKLARQWPRRPQVAFSQKHEVRHEDANG